MCWCLPSDSDLSPVGSGSLPWVHVCVYIAMVFHLDSGRWHARVSPKLLRTSPMCRKSIGSGFFPSSSQCCLKHSGDFIASCRLWTEKSQCAQPGPALLVPMANLPSVCSDTAGTTQLFVRALSGAGRNVFLISGFICL